MASIHGQDNAQGKSWRVKWRHNGKQESISFDDEAAAHRFKADVEQHGPEEALRVLEVLEAEAKVPTVSEYLKRFIDGLTGVQPATLNRYRTYLSRDITPAFGSLPLIAVTEHTIGAWVTAMSQEKVKGKDGKLHPVSKKTLANKHAFLSGAFKQAVKDKLIPSNPCEGRRLPDTQAQEKIYLTAAEFELLRSYLPDRYKPFATFLVLTGMRFSEATALIPDDIDLVRKTVRVNKAWKYATKREDITLGPPKTKKAYRTISLPDAALIGLDLGGEWVFTNPSGGVVRAQEFYNQAWKPARRKAMAAGLKKCPRVHDLRHTHVSWLIEAGVHLAVIQKRLGHESIKTTIDVYGELDQSSDTAAAMLLDTVLTSTTFGEVPQLG